MRKRKKLNEWCHAATCLRVSLAGKDVLQRFFDITQEDYFTQMEKENPQKVEQIKEQMTSLGCYSESLTIGETIWELFENCCIEDPRYYRAADCAADQNLRIYSTEKDWDILLYWIQVKNQFILSYLLAKNVCWNYEKEWRIINVGEENTPLFIDLPFVKSITFGMNMDPICKQLLWDVCKEKGIECYEIEIGTENYELRRKYLSKKDFTYDIDLELNYIDILTKQISVASERIGKMGENIENEIENKNFSNVSPMLSDTLDMLSNSYYLKISLNRICEHETEELSSTGMPNEILNNISLVNTFVSQAKEMCVALKENMPIFLLGGLIKGHEYTIINKQLGDIHELVGKFENIEWNSFCIKIVSEDTENNSEYSEVDDVVKISE